MGYTILQHVHWTCTYCARPAQTILGARAEVSARPEVLPTTWVGRPWEPYCSEECQKNQADRRAAWVTWDNARLKAGLLADKEARELAEARKAEWVAKNPQPEEPKKWDGGTDGAMQQPQKEGDK